MVGWARGKEESTSENGRSFGIPLLGTLVTYLTCSMSLLIEPEVHAPAALVGGPVVGRMDEG